MTDKTLNVALMRGGHTAEREVSLNSGAAVQQALETLGHVVFPVDDIAVLKALHEKVDVVFNLLHGADGEDGQLAAWLNQEGYAYTGCDHLAGALSWYKDKSKVLVAAEGVSTPNAQCISDVNDLAMTTDGPWIVKPAGEGSSVGLFKANNSAELLAAVEESLRLSKLILIEDYIEGVECTVGIVGGEVLPVVSIVPDGELYDYQAKYESKNTQYHCPPNFDRAWQKALQQDAIKVFNALSLSGWGRVDFIVDDQGRRWFLEANTTPGMTKTSLLPKAAAVHGWDFTTLVAKILNSAFVGGCDE
ncbi:D-alanine--D-alanine ligase family protein [Marinicella rhabdoformis]|uniref:D-alanine--D-alanine ligase family protein n=1 Tax=Marinicella rhabdoformis TaxID=2580566 RepID=UPI0012AED721|nr:D-alanine--D-alanine ligase [Marinicella rhabdoformis]